MKRMLSVSVLVLPAVLASTVACSERTGGSTETLRYGANASANTTYYNGLSVLGPNLPCLEKTGVNDSWKSTGSSDEFIRFDHNVELITAKNNKSRFEELAKFWKSRRGSTVGAGFVFFDESNRRGWLGGQRGPAAEPPSYFCKVTEDQVKKLTSVNRELVEVAVSRQDAVHMPEISSFSVSEVSQSRVTFSTFKRHGSDGAFFLKLRPNVQYQIWIWALGRYNLNVSEFCQPFQIPKGKQFSELKLELSLKDPSRGDSGGFKCRFLVE